MIRNNYLLAYESDNNSSITDQEEKYISHGENYNVYLERPLESSKIEKIKDNKLYKFVDNVMCDKNVNHLLYSSNAKKIAKFYLKQKKFLLRQHNPLQIEEDNLFRKKVISFNEKIKRQKIMEDIKENVEKFRVNRSISMTQMIKKNTQFLNSQPNVDKKIEKLNSKTINELRLKGYKKAFEKCLNLSITRNDFELPDLTTNDTFGRLYNNDALRINYKMKKNNSADKILFLKDITTGKNPFSYKNLLSRYKIKKSKKDDSILEDDINQHYKKRIVKFKLNSNITRGDHNMKQFNIGITKQMIKRCWSTISGGPKKKNEEKIIKEKLQEKFKEKFSYKILSNKRNGDIKDLSLYNTMVADDPFLKNYMIKNKNYRDDKNNSSLHIAVKNNSIKMVKYLLSKKEKNINAKNGKGQTALHIACSNENDEIINLLVLNGANINILDFQGKKPFDFLSSERTKN